jgi:hypothetical protein
LEAQQHKKYAQTTPLDDGVSSLLKYVLLRSFPIMKKYRYYRLIFPPLKAPQKNLLETK